MWILAKNYHNKYIINTDILIKITKQIAAQRNFVINTAENLTMKQNGIVSSFAEIIPLTGRAEKALLSKINGVNVSSIYSTLSAQYKYVHTFTT